jgi:hypothetical protein
MGVGIESWLFSSPCLPGYAQYVIGLVNCAILHPCYRMLLWQAEQVEPAKTVDLSRVEIWN